MEHSTKRGAIRASLLGGLALTGQAAAQDGAAPGQGLYIGAEAGFSFLQDTDIEVAGNADAALVEHDTGSLYGAFAGYDFGAFRLEASVSAWQSDTETVTQNLDPPVVLETDGQADALTYMLSGLFDIGDPSGLNASLGGGIGFTDFDNFASIDTPGGPVAIIDDSDTGFTWQLLAEARYPLAPRWDIGARYRYAQFEIEQTDTMDLDVAFTDRVHFLTASVSYRFD